MPPSSITITNPLTLYRSYLATSRLLPDPHQHRIALLLEPVYERLHSYTPPPELDTRLRALTRTLSAPTPSSPPRRRTLFSSLQDRADLALVRSLSEKDTAIEANTPKGFFLHGEVGTGKSLLLDLLYHSLPNPGKRRWHFHAFMLLLYERLAQGAGAGAGGMGHEHALLRIARQLALETPIVFLDEIQFPDRAAAKIVSELLVRFWSLGGVLVGSSNRSPGELAKAAGAGRSGEFEGFEQAVGSRCEEVRIEGARDWRKERRDGWWRVGVDAPASVAEEESGYWFYGEGEPWSSALSAATGTTSPSWQQKTITVYSRPVLIPRLYNGVALFTFQELCTQDLGPADYLSLCTHLHTLFLTSLPPLSHSRNKNEARRFITLLDAIYESGVRLCISTTEPLSIDTLLFQDLPSTVLQPIHAETFADSAYASGFRPNTSTRNEGFREESGQDFWDVAAFTGVDEVFAARRAASRVCEVTGVGWWRGVVWKGAGDGVGMAVGTGEVGEVEAEARKVGGALQRGDAPKFEQRHFWSLGRWGKRAGTWGLGVDGRGGRE